VPSVSALPPRPATPAGGTFDPLPQDQWADAAESWSAEYDAALAAVVDGVAVLEGIELDLDERSAVTETLTALTLVAPATGDRAYLVMSDLDENEPQQPAAFAKAPVFVIQPDPYGDLRTWDALFSTFSTWATASGAASVERVRPELAPALIHTFLIGA
jgi:hypothetical protein